MRSAAPWLAVLNLRWGQIHLGAMDSASCLVLYQPATLEWKYNGIRLRLHLKRGRRERGKPDHGYYRAKPRWSPSGTGVRVGNGDSIQHHLCDERYYVLIALFVSPLEWLAQQSGVTE